MEVLTKKQYKEYDRVSRYSVFPYYYNRLDEKYIYGITAQLKKDNTPYVVHTVKLNDTLDSLSLYYYGNPLYYWIIADFNNIQDPYINLEVGQKLNIPTFNSIEFNIGVDR